MSVENDCWGLIRKVHFFPFFLAELFRFFFSAVVVVVLRLLSVYLFLMS